MASSPSTPSSGRFNLGEKLFRQYEVGKHVDATIYLGDWILHAHRAILTTASDEFDRQIREQEQQHNGGRGAVIGFPAGTTLAVAKAFIKVNCG